MVFPCSSHPRSSVNRGSSLVDPAALLRRVDDPGRRSDGTDGDVGPEPSGLGGWVAKPGVEDFFFKNVGKRETTQKTMEQN